MCGYENRSLIQKFSHSSFLLEKKLLMSVMALGEGKDRKAAQASSRKGCMRGKGGPENAFCTFKGVRQRTWGKWVAEIREPNGGNRSWLGTFKNSYEAAVAYDAAARKLYGLHAKLNLPHLYEENPQFPVSPNIDSQVHIQENPLFASQSAALPAVYAYPFQGVFLNNTLINVNETEFVSWKEMSNNMNMCLPEVDDSGLWAEAAKDTTFQFVEEMEIFMSNLDHGNGFVKTEVQETRFASVMSYGIDESN